MKTFFVAVTLFTALLFGAEGFALEFSADTVSTHKTGEGVISSKIYIKDKKYRHDNPGQASYTIIRQDKNVVWMVMPDKKSYMEMPINPSQLPRTQEKFPGEISRKQIGTETVNGHPTKKYEIIYKTENKNQTSYQWIATDINFPIKQAAVDGSWAFEYRNIKMGSQPDSLFEVPPGYQKVSMPTRPQR